MNLLATKDHNNKVNNSNNNKNNNNNHLLSPPPPTKLLEVEESFLPINCQRTNSKKIRPLPMFDTARNNNNQNNQSQGVNNLFPQNPSGWNPLHSINLNVNEDNNQKARLPVFSTLSK